MLGFGFYTAYATFAYLGSRTGQTYGCHPFDLGSPDRGSCRRLCSPPRPGVGFRPGRWCRLGRAYGWGQVLALTLIFAGVMILANLPASLVALACTRHADHPLGRTPVIAKRPTGQLGGSQREPLPFWLGVTAVIASAVQRFTS